MLNTRAIGERGEQLAVEYLEKSGYRIIHRNVNIGGGEIDIVASVDDTVVFVEVRSRATLKYGSPLESITPSKVKSLMRSIRTYIAKYKLHGKLIRIDVIGVCDDSIEHVKDALWYN